MRVGVFPMPPLCSMSRLVNSSGGSTIRLCETWFARPRPCTATATRQILQCHDTSVMARRTSGFASLVAPRRLCYDINVIAMLVWSRARCDTSGMARASFQSMSRRIPRGNPKTAIAYLRVSTDEQALGPAAQRAAIERWAATQGVTVLAWHCDQGVSGAAALDKRPGLTAALGAVTEHGAGLLVVAKRDRLARDVVLAAMIESLAKRTGARVVSAAGEGEGDDGDPASLLMRRMVDVFAEYERAIIRARTRSALAVKRGRGERTGEIPFGLRLAADGVHFEPAAAERAVVARVRHLRAEGLSFRAIVASCDREGLVARTGRPLSKTQVERIVARAA